MALFMPVPALNIPDTTSKKKLLTVIFRSRKFPYSHVVIILIAATFIGGLELLVNYDKIWLNLAAVPMISVAMILALYLSHDCAHLLVFKSRKKNIILGEVLSLINGLSYSSFNDYRRDHIRHHADKVDLVGINMAKFLSAMPKWLSLGLLALEKVYIPSCFYAIKFHTIVTGLKGSSQEKIRIIFCLACYTTLFVMLATASALSLVLLFVASFIRIHIARFVDAFQHSYTQIDPDIDISIFYSKVYELSNTYSVPIARKWTWLNYLILNFGYHGTHHALPSCPWYLLPLLEKEILKMNSIPDAMLLEKKTDFSFRNMLLTYHKLHMVRLLAEDEGKPYDELGVFALERFTGAYTDKLLG